MSSALEAHQEGFIQQNLQGLFNRDCIGEKNMIFASLEHVHVI